MIFPVSACQDNPTICGQGVAWLGGQCHHIGYGLSRVHPTGRKILFAA